MSWLWTANTGSVFVVWIYIPIWDLYMQSKIQVYRDIYKACKKGYSVIIKTAKANYIQNIITRSSNSPKVLWKFVNIERGSPK
jgi:hypothetical protein